MVNQSQKNVDGDQHGPQDQLRGIDYCITSPPPWPQAIALGFQHYLVVLGAIVLIPSILVPQMGGDNVYILLVFFCPVMVSVGLSILDKHDKIRVIQTLLFVAGINTLLQALFGTTLPAVIGGSYAFLIPTISIIYSDRLQSIPDNQERFLQTMRAIQGALIASSSLQIVLGFSGLWGIVTRFLSPLSAIPLITMVSLGLYELGFPGLAKCIEIGIPALFLVVVLSQYLSRMKTGSIQIFERFAVLLTIVIIWAYAHLLTVSGAYRHASDMGKQHCRTDRAGLVSAAPWIRIPYPLQWGAPSFDAGQTFAMMAAVFVSMVESTGGFLVVSRFASATPPPPFVYGRGIGWQGIGILLGGMFGTLNGFTVSIENAGLLGLTRVGSRRVVQLAGAFMIAFSLFGKFGAIFASIPLPIVAALYCVLFCKVVGCGVSFVQFVNINSPRSMFVVGISLFLGLSVPQYFKEFARSAGHGPVHTHSHWFNDIFLVVFTSAATVAMFVALLLDNTIHPKESQRERGMLWWAKFRNWKDDPRNEEFYSLPFNLNKFFPPI